LAEPWQAEIAKLREQVTTLEAQLAAKDEALRNYVSYSTKVCRQVGCKGCGIDPQRDCPERPFMEAALKALSGDTRQIERDARIGRAVEAWQKREAAVMATMGSRGWREAISTLGEVIARAKAGEPRG
jgi:hypothetical protein